MRQTVANEYGIHETRKAQDRYRRRKARENEILKELKPPAVEHVDLTGLETYIQQLRNPKEPTMSTQYLVWLDVETSGLDPMADTLLEVEARITNMKGYPLLDNDAGHAVKFHRVIRLGDNTPIRTFDSTTIDMHSRNGLIGECMNAEYTLKDVDKQMTAWFDGLNIDPGLIHPAGTNVQFDLQWLDVNMPITSVMLHKLSHRRLDLTSIRLVEIAKDMNPYDCGHDTTHRTADCLDRDLSEYKTIIK